MTEEKPPDIDKFVPDHTELMVHEATALAYYERNGMLREKKELEEQINIRKEIDEHFKSKFGIKEKVICLFIGHGDLIKTNSYNVCKRCGYIKWKK